MEQTKRKRNNAKSNSHGNKRKKLQTQTIKVNKSSFSDFEDLSNDLIYEIFDYLDVFHIYKSFYDLNQRFENLLIHSILPININLSSMSKSNFENYYSKILLPNKHRILSLHLSNIFHINIVFSSAHLLSNFLRLETLILDHIKVQRLEAILNYASSLPNLHSLVINPIDCIDNSNDIYRQIFRLSQLKFCKTSLGINSHPDLLPICDNKYSSIERLIIEDSVCYDGLDRLLSYVPRLHKLSIESLNGSFCRKTELSTIHLSHLLYLNLDCHNVDFNQFEIFIQDCFHQLHVLRLSTNNDNEYLNANRWEQLIIFRLPSLHVFDLKHAYNRYSNTNESQLSYDILKNKFSSSFWMGKQYFLAYEYDTNGNITVKIFYSKDLYKYEIDDCYDKINRTYLYIFRKQHYKSLQIKNPKGDTFHPMMDFNSIQHIRIRSRQALNDCAHYFPNVTNLTLAYDLIATRRSIETALNSIIPLKQITKLVIECHYISFTELINLLCLTHNLHTLKLHCICLNEDECVQMQQNESFRLVSNTNIIKNVILNERCTLGRAQLFVGLCPQLEQLTTGIDRANFESIIQILFSKRNNNSQKLFSLCITSVPKLCIRQLKRCIKLEKLLDDYLIEYVNDDLYLWR